MTARHCIKEGKVSECMWRRYRERVLAGEAAYDMSVTPGEWLRSGEKECTKEVKSEGLILWESNHSCVPFDCLLVLHN